MRKTAARTRTLKPGPMALFVGLRVIYRHLSVGRRRQFFLVMVLMTFGAFAELGTIGAVIPFIALLANSEGRHESWLSWIPGAEHGLLTVAAAAFIVFAVVAGLIRFQLAMTSRRFIFHLGHELAVQIQRRVLLQPYSFHVHRNTSTLVSAFTKTEFVVGAMLLPLMHAVTGSVIAIFVVALLVAVDPVITAIVAVSLAITYGAFSAVFSKRLEAISAVQKHSYDELTQLIQESLAGVREVIIDGSQRMYVDEFRRINLRLANARSTSQMVFLAPHYLIETVGMVLIAIAAVIMASRPGGVAVALPILGTLVLGAQRLLPLVQDVYRGWSGVAGNRSLFDEVVALLSLPDERTDETPGPPLSFKSAIRLDDVGLRYATRNSPALHGVNLTIPKGTMAAVVGETGSGKSSLVDILMGLLPPTEGRVIIDDVALSQANRVRWHASIAHVPQSIFLADATVARNIALSLPHDAPNHDRVVAAAKRAQLHDFILSLPDGYDTRVGERGIRLSGGQRQRLGIARAIYKDTPVLVLDEATSALDDGTEAAVIEALQQLRREGLSVIIIAHRQSTVAHCTMVVELAKGRVVSCRNGAKQSAES